MSSQQEGLVELVEYLSKVERKHYKTPTERANETARSLLPVDVDARGESKRGLGGEGVGKQTAPNQMIFMILFDTIRVRKNGESYRPHVLPGTRNQAGFFCPNYILTGVVWSVGLMARLKCLKARNEVLDESTLQCSIRRIPNREPRNHQQDGEAKPSPTVCSQISASADPGA